MRKVLFDNNNFNQSVHKNLREGDIRKFPEKEVFFSNEKFIKKSFFNWDKVS